MVPADAATVSWIAGSGVWNTASNWSTGASPGPSDDAVISPDGTLTVSGFMPGAPEMATGSSLTIVQTQ
jgi:hypothetical protein